MADFPPDFAARTPATLAGELAERVALLPARARVLVDGVGGDALADALAEQLAHRGRVPLRVRGADFLRPAGQRYEHGREDVQSFRDDWLDVGALRREVLDDAQTWLPALWDATRERSARAARAPVPPQGVVVVDGLFLLGHGLPAQLTVHVALSPGALRRRGVPQWQLPAFAAYDREVAPADHCQVLVRAEDAQRPAVRYR